MGYISKQMGGINGLQCMQTCIMLTQFSLDNCNYGAIDLKLSYPCFALIMAISLVFFHAHCTLH